MIRFQASPNCRIEEQDWTLMPQKVSATSWVEGNRAVLKTGNMRAEIYDNGRVIYYYNDREVLKEKPELTFDAQIRNFKNIGSNLWKARVSFEANVEEHFYGL